MRALTEVLELHSFCLVGHLSDPKISLQMGQTRELHPAPKALQ